jgi:cytochrome c-type biogenesis protein CcmH
MILFWSLAAALLLVAIAAVVWPLLRSHSGTVDNATRLNVAIHRDRLAELESDVESGELGQEQLAEARADLERDLLNDVADDGKGRSTLSEGGGRWMALAIVLLVPLFTVLLYLQVGMPDAVDGPPPVASHTGAPDIQAMVAGLEQRLVDNPDNFDGWMMLGRSYTVVGRAADAVKAYARATTLQPDNVEALLFHAEAIANASGGSLMSGQAPELVERAYKLKPENPTVMWMTGVIRYQSGDYREALALWQRVLPTQQPGSEGHTMVSQAIADAREALGEPVTASADAGGAAAAAVDGPTLKVEVDISDAMALAASVDDTLFIFARAANGSKAPLALVRKSVVDLPLTVTLDRSMAMVSGMDLASQPLVTVHARVSKSGNAVPQPGDLEGSSSAVEPGQDGVVRVVIDRMVE